MDWEDTGRRDAVLWRIMERPSGSKVRKLVARLSGRDPLTGDTRTYRFAHGNAPSSRIALVNHLTRLNAYETYLEIGVRQRSAMFERILCPHKVGVDPDPRAEADFVMTSDAYFSTETERFDMVFIDGGHTGDQVERDILNALDRLTPHGVILLHDINPPTAFHARRNYAVDGRFPAWNGTSWKGFAALRRSRDDLEMCVVDTDWGVGIVRPGRQKPYDGPCATYSDLAADRQAILNLILVPEFLRRYDRAFAALPD